ncbi:MAG TPA: hypothetical protein VLR90_07625 [Blastocatellia bacterium]|nr:hypothetical protein [Blastocatellia bacterium]
MEISDQQREQIQKWLAENGRECPMCKAGAEQLVPYGEVFMALPPEATEGQGIDTSYDDVRRVKIKCNNCGFDQASIDLDAIGI